MTQKTHTCTFSVQNKCTSPSKWHKQVKKKAKENYDSTNDTIRSCIFNEHDL